MAVLVAGMTCGAEFFQLREQWLCSVFVEHSSPAKINIRAAEAVDREFFYIGTVPNPPLTHLDPPKLALSRIWARGWVPGGRRAKSDGVLVQNRFRKPKVMQCCS